MKGRLGWEGTIIRVLVFPRKQIMDEEAGTSGESELTSQNLFFFSFYLVKCDGGRLYERDILC